jgi:hypothetical protein
MEMIENTHGAPMTRKAIRGPTAYFDIIPGLDAALYNNGAVIECKSTGEAIKQIQRMNQFRILDRKMNHEKRLRMELPEGIHRGIEIQNRENLYYLKSIYDVLVIRRRDTKIVIERRPKTPWLAITDLDGNPIETTPVQVFDPIQDAYEKEYDRFNERIELEKKRPTVSGGTTQAPREKHNATKPLNLMDESDE